MLGAVIATANDLHFEMWVQFPQPVFHLLAEPVRGYVILDQSATGGPVDNFLQAHVRLADSCRGTQPFVSIPLGERLSGFLAKSILGLRYG